MATQVQLRRGTSAENDSFTGAQGELTYDTTNKRVRIHDGGTAGGFEISRADASNLTFPDGSVGSPAISFASDTNTGIYRGGTDILKFVTAGTDAITIDASQNVTFAGDLTVDTNTLYVDSTNNRVGIGTTGPATPLDVRTTSPIIRSTYDSTGTYVQMFHNGSNSYFDFSSGSQIWRGAGQAERMRIDSSGNVGIGKSNPSVPLDVNGIIRTTDAYSFSYAGVPGSTSAFGAGTISADANWGMYFKATTGSALADFAWVAGAGTERMRITSGGDLSLTGDSSAGETNLVFTADSNTTKARIQGSKAGASGGKLIFSTNNTSSTLTERMRIDSSGSVAIGSTSTASADRLTLKGSTTDGTTNFIVRNSADGTLLTVANNGTVTIFNNLLVGCTGLPSSGGGGAGFETGQTNGRTILQLGTTTTSQITVQRFYNPNGNVGEIKLSGSSTIYATTSDYRLKENVTADWDATTRLKQLQPKRFNFIADADTTVDGFLAHEVQSVVPEAITGTHNEVDADGNPVYQGIDQSKLVPLLVKTIQELEARITALETA
jgi:hypothetical protein